MTNAHIFTIITAFAAQCVALATAVFYFWRKAEAAERAALMFARAIYEEKKARGSTAEQARDKMVAEFCGAESTPDGQ